MTLRVCFARVWVAMAIGVFLGAVIVGCIKAVQRYGMLLPLTALAIVITAWALNVVLSEWDL